MYIRGENIMKYWYNNQELIYSKEDYQKALTDGRIIVVGVHYNPNNKSFGYGWNGFRVFEIRDNQLIELMALSNYWSEKKGYYSINVMGSDRRFEAIYHIGTFLGLTHAEIPQNYKTIVGGF